MKQPASVRAALEMATEFGWEALVTYRTPVFTVELMQRRSNGERSASCFMVEFHNRGGWKPTRQWEQITWQGYEPTSRLVTWQEIRQTVRGL